MRGAAGRTYSLVGSDDGLFTAKCREWNRKTPFFELQTTELLKH
jgi:hypothetical protein